MEIIFRPIYNSTDEISMGHRTWYRESIEVDAISATANNSGFSPLKAIVRNFGWRTEIISSAVERCNTVQEVAIVNVLQPKLLLVPKTKGQNGLRYLPIVLANDLINACNAINVRVLSFSHFGFIQTEFPRKEIASILRIFFNKSTASSIRVLIWDIDIRHKSEMLKLYEDIKFEITQTRTNERQRVDPLRNTYLNYDNVPQVAQRTEEDHLRGQNMYIQRLWKRFRAEIVALPNIKITVRLFYIHIQKKYTNICFVNFRQNQFIIEVYLGSINAQGVRSRNYFQIVDPLRLGTMRNHILTSGYQSHRYKFTITNLTDLKYCLAILLQKYESLR